jgi:signal transduction histidine kinase
LPTDLVDVLRSNTATVGAEQPRPAGAHPAPVRRDADREAGAVGKEPGSRDFGGRDPGLVNGRSPASVKTALQGLLKDCQEKLKFEMGALFAFDSVQRTVELVCSTGRQANTAGIPSLAFSPVRDAAEDGDEVVLEDLHEHNLGRFRYLLEFFPLQACCGVRVPSGAARRYALFLFHGGPKKIPEESLVFTRGIALAIGALLDRQMFQEHAILVQRTALLGHLTRGLVHEINHQIGPLNLTLEDLEALLGEIKSESASPEAVESKSAMALDQITEMRRLVTAMTNTTRQFGRIITRPKEEFLRIDEPVENAIKLLREVSDRMKVRVAFEPPRSLVLVRSQGAVIEQILINLLLNAIQQINERPHAPGWVQVRVETRRAEDGEKICIRVEDNGPGIHLRQWEQIFDVGYTTREDGSGMGLYISRGLVEALGGKLYVEESYILGGSIFALEIPGSM